MPKCSFKFCKNVQYPKNRGKGQNKQQKDGISFFNFPGQVYRREQWIEIVRRQRGEPFFEPRKTSVVCDKHFNKNDFYVTSTGTTRLCNTAVPIIDTPEATCCEDPLQPSTSKSSSHFVHDTSDTDENSERVRKNIKRATARLDMKCEVEDNTQLTSFDIPFLPSTRYPGYESSSDASDTNEICDEIEQKINTDTARDIAFVEIKKDENSKQLKSCVDPLQSDTSTPKNDYSRVKCDINEVEKKIKIEVQESTSNTEEYIDNRLDDRMSTRGNRFEKFGEYVVTMLNNMPLQQALDLQPQIVNLITSTMNNRGNEANTIHKIRIKTEEELCGEKN